MLNKRKSVVLNFIIISLLGIFLVNLNLITIVDANINYTIAIEKGTQILEVKQYDAQAWKNTVSLTLNPSDLFGGEADKVGAKSKFTNLGWGYNDIGAYFVFVDLVIPKEALPIFSIVENYGYNFTYININFKRYYNIWDFDFSYWSFTTNEFDYNPDVLYYHSYIIQNPQDFKKMLDDYNNFSAVINNDTTLQSLGYSFPILSGDDLLWQFIISRFAIATPISDYLTIMIDILECKNVIIHNNSIILQRSGEQNYSIETTYNIQGTIDSFIVKNSESNIIYKITSFYPKIIFYIILGIIAICVLGLAIIIIIKKRRLQ